MNTPEEIAREAAQEIHGYETTDGLDIIDVTTRVILAAIKKAQSAQPEKWHYEAFDGHHVCRLHPNGGSIVLFTCETHSDAVLAIELHNAVPAQPVRQEERNLLFKIRDLLEYTDIECFGRGNDGQGTVWPIRDEVIDSINKVLSVATSLKDEAPVASAATTVDVQKFGQWIAVTDQLPSGSEEVLYWDGEEVGTFIPNTGEHPIHQASIRCNQFGLTHWMPLPAAPESDSTSGVSSPTARDTARLDWLEENKSDIDAPVELISQWNVFNQERFEGQTLREAIDAAMENQQ